MKISAIGGDPALRHGVFVLGEWEIGPKPRLIRYQSLYEWTKKSPHLSEKSTLDGFRRASRAIVTSCRERMGRNTLPVGIDWVASTGFMGRRITASVLSYFLGYLTREFEVYGFPVVIITPAEVRKQLGLPHNSPKETVWHELRQMMNDTQARMSKDVASDLRDALMLSYLTAVGRSRNETS